MSERLKPTREHLAWPFFGPEHSAFAAELDGFVGSGALDAVDHHDVDGTCRTLVRRMGAAGLLRACVARPRIACPNGSSSRIGGRNRAAATAWRRRPTGSPSSRSS